MVFLISLKGKALFSELLKSQTGLTPDESTVAEPFFSQRENAADTDTSN